MGGRRGQTRQRMLLSAIALLRERGARGVTIDAVLADSGAPRGSVYHHFPEGREQLVREAVAHASDFIGALISDFADDPSTALERFVDLWAQVLRDSDYRAGCPIVGIAVDADVDTDLGERAFRGWADQLTRLYHAQGIAEADAARLASSTIAAVEGAIVLCRVQRSTQPLDDARRMLQTYHASLVPEPA